jgi:uncharacterized membrane protein YebE (DUF533 family)
MFDANNLLGRVINSGAAGGFLGGALGAGAVGMLGSKKGRKIAKSALKMGGIAAVGALAYHAYTRYKAGQDAANAAAVSGFDVAAVPVSRATADDSAAESRELRAAPPGSGFVPDASDHEALQSIGVTLIRAMIAAAKADGEIDSIEGRRLFAEMERQGLDQEERAFVLQELSRPVDLESIVGAASTPELAAEIYTASAMAIDVSNQAESAYLQLLASRLDLEEGLLAELNRTVSENSFAGAPA